MNTEPTKEKKKSWFSWLIALIMVVFFAALFINGYLIFKETGMDDEDVTVFE